MSKRKAYPGYKPSGVDWIGNIPTTWSVLPLFSVARHNRRSNRGMVESNLLSLSYGNIVDKDINTSEGLLPDSFETYQIVESDDVVFRLTDLQNDKRSLRSALVSARGIITSAYLSVKPEGIDPRYFAYAMRDADLRKVFYSMGGGLRQSMKFDDLRWLPVVCPPRADQEAVVDFLDRETAKIDKLIEQSKMLIEKLQKRRAAIIAAATTGQIDVREGSDSGDTPGDLEGAA